MAKAVKIVDKIKRFPSKPDHVKSEAHSKKLNELIAGIQDVEEPEVAQFLVDNALPELLRIYDGYVQDPTVKKEAMYILKMFALYNYPSGIERLKSAVRNPMLADEWMWDPIFEIIMEKHEKTADDLAEFLRDPLPQKNAGLYYLDLCNVLCRENALNKHPFDCAAGRQMLEDWLNDNHAEPMIAAAALIYIKSGWRDRLLKKALKHPEPRVRVDAAYAYAKLEGEKGYKLLSNMCKDVSCTLDAQGYLKKLGKEGLIPEESKDITFLAKAKLGLWLAHPMEFGKYPVRMELYDTRELFWPPTNDRRRLWLIKYYYADPSDTGVGIVGSILWSFQTEEIVDMTPEDIYGMFCCSELWRNQDKRAPKKQSREAGRKILAKYNKDF